MKSWKSSDFGNMEISYDEEEEKIVAEAVVITADMPDAMKDVSIATARSAMGEYSIDKDVATAIKKKTYIVII